MELKGLGIPATHSGVTYWSQLARPRRERSSKMVIPSGFDRGGENPAFPFWLVTPNVRLSRSVSLLSFWFGVKSLIPGVI
jgi:hypothetical protein